MADLFDPAAGKPQQLPRSLAIERALMALAMALLAGVLVGTRRVRSGRSDRYLN